MIRPTRTATIGLVLVLLGVSVIMATLASLSATEWVVDPLRYTDVRYRQNFRGPPSIHMTGVDGETYRLPERLWGDAFDGRELVRILLTDSMAVVRVVGGEDRLMHGHPTVEGLRTSEVTLEAPPRHPARMPLMVALGPLCLLVGVVVAVRGGWR